MNNKLVKKFELDPKSVKVKDMLNKDFLELEIKAISTANPNRNGSTFSREALEKAIPTFYNKPILGSFSVSQDDFRAHEAELSYDEDYEQMYYDYTDEVSETPLGLIRGDDKIEIVHDKKDGLDWIKFTCAIWVKYNYKQVKKLLKSKDGHKKVSVEVEVTSSEFDAEGIEHINEFVFDGVTILGDKYETGIADANMTILDMIDNALFQKQQKCLAFAYNSLDKQNVETPSEVKISDKDSNINFKKEEAPIANEDEPLLEMEKKVNQEEGGILAMPLTMQAKIDLLRVALEKALYGDKEDCCCYIWVMDICEKFVYYEFQGEKFRCPYVITELGEEHEVMLDLSAQERVVPSWSVFSAEENSEVQKEDFDHEEGEGHKCIECTIRDLIIDEEEAIQGYSHAEKHFEEEYPLIAKIFHEIKEEEETHVGELTQALQMINDETIEHQEEGIQEAKEIVAEEILEEQGEKEESEGGMEKIFAEDEEPEQKDKEKDPEDNPENVDAPEDDDDTKKDYEDDNDEDDKDEDDDKDDSDDDKDDDEDDDKDEPDDKDDTDDKDDDEDDSDDVDDKDDDEDFGCGKEVEGCGKETEGCGKETEGCNTDMESCNEEFSNTLDPNAEPINVDVDGQTMSQIITDATQSIKAPEVQTNVEGMGNANAEVAKVMNDVEKVVIEGDPDGTANEDGSPINPQTIVKQPDDKQKEHDKQFVSQVDASNINVEDLLKKYTELEAKFNELNDANRAKEAEKLLQFGKDFINADRVVDEETKQNYISQVEEKCKAFELNTEEEVTKFAKGLMAMYYYEHQAVRKENNSSEEFSLTLNKPTRANNNASKLKDAINKLNYLNKEE